MSKPVPIVIPLHHGGGKHKTDTELRFALRSIERHFTDAFQIIIIGRKLPEWITGVHHIKCGKGLKTAVRMAAEIYPEGFFWYYDDCCLLRDTSAGLMKVTPACRRWSNATSAWAKKLDGIRKRLSREGHEARDYSRPHGPYWFDKGMIDEAFADWPRMEGKFPFESWILSKRKWPKIHGAVKQYYGPFRAEPKETSRYLNYNDRGNTMELRNWLRARFPDQSRFELTPEMSKKSIYAGQAEYLRDAWVSIGSPPLRTICECAVGPHSLLELFEGQCERAVFIEPDPKMASDARTNYPWAEIHQVAISDKMGTANLRRLNGSSYIKGIAWAPAFDAFPQRARRAGKVAVSTITFDRIDDGKIDVLNLDCEGSEWHVLRNMASRPVLVQVETYDRNPDHAVMVEWFEANGYREIKRWGNANRIYTRIQA